MCFLSIKTCKPILVVTRSKIMYLKISTVRLLETPSLVSAVTQYSVFTLTCQNHHPLISLSAPENSCSTRGKVLRHILTWDAVRACHFSFWLPTAFPFFSSKGQAGPPSPELLIYLFSPSHLLSSPPRRPPSLFFLLTGSRVRPPCGLCRFSFSLRLFSSSVLLSFFFSLRLC